MYAPCVRMTCTLQYACHACVYCMLMLFILKHIYVYITYICSMIWTGVILVSFTYIHISSYIMFFVSETLLSSLSTLGQIVLLEIGSCSHHTQVLVIITLGSFLYLRICRQESSPYGLSMGNRVQVATGTFVAKSFNLSFLCKGVVFCMSFLMKVSSFFVAWKTLPSTRRHRRTGTAHKGTDRGMCSRSPHGGGRLANWDRVKNCKVDLNWNPNNINWIELGSGFCEMWCLRQPKNMTLTFFRPEIRRKLVRCV